MTITSVKRRMYNGCYRGGKVYIGGKEYGEGRYGKTMDVAHDASGQSVYDELLLIPPERRGDCVAWGISGKDKRPLTAADFEAVMRLLATEKSMVGKRFKDDVISDFSAFKIELAQMSKVSTALGAHLQRCSTIRSIRLPHRGIDMFGLQTPIGCYLFTGKCTTPLDRFHFTTSKIDKFVRDILFCFARLHEGRMFHMDVKLDNMIYCKTDDRFKLIDWGNSDDMDGLLRRYVNQERPRNSGSPFAWLAWGTGPALPIVHAAYMLYWHAYDSFTCGTFQRFTSRMQASFDAKKEQLIDAANTGRVIDDATRRKLLRTYARSFDLFNLGMTLVHLACVYQPRINQTLFACLLDLARRLTHYGDDDFTQDADAALRWWSDTYVVRRR